MIEFDTQAKVVAVNQSEVNVFAIVMEVCPGGDLFDFIFNTGELSEFHARFYFRQLCDALTCMQEKGKSI